MLKRTSELLHVYKSSHHVATNDSYLYIKFCLIQQDKEKFYLAHLYDKQFYDLMCKI